MADTTQGERLKIIAGKLEATYLSLKLAASNISGLVTSGRATCAEVKAYNLWALAIYQTQVGMLSALRAGGQPEVPALPPQPTLFAWKGVKGANAVNFECGAPTQGLSGALNAAMNDPQPVLLPADKIEIVTQDVYALNPAASPSFQSLLEAQAKNEAEAAKPDGLGLAPLIWIAIAAISIGVGVAIAAIMKYLEVNSIQEANTEQVRLQADAFAKYTAARLDCYKDCTSRGGSAADCTATCGKLVKEPSIKLPGQDGKWGMLQWIGAIVVGSGALWITYKLYERKKRTGHILPQIDFSLPEGT